MTQIISGWISFIEGDIRVTVTTKIFWLLHFKEQGALLWHIIETFHLQLVSRIRLRKKSFSVEQTVFWFSLFLQTNTIWNRIWWLRHCLKGSNHPRFYLRIRSGVSLLGKVRLLLCCIIPCFDSEPISLNSSFRRFSFARTFEPKRTSEPPSSCRWTLFEIVLLSFYLDKSAKFILTLHSKSNACAHWSVIVFLFSSHMGKQKYSELVYLKIWQFWATEFDSWVMASFSRIRSYSRMGNHIHFASKGWLFSVDALLLQFRKQRDRFGRKCHSI